MNWNEKCLMELTHHNMFEDDSHRQRFRDLLNCYFTSAFFCKELCKCMFLFSWDEEHFIMLLEVLNEMTLDGERDLRLMKDQGEVQERHADGYDAEIFKLANAFLNHTEYEMMDFGVIEPELIHVLRRTLQTAAYIDELPELTKH